MAYVLVVDAKVHHVYDDEAHALNEKRRLDNRGKKWSALDTTHHTCPMRTFPAMTHRYTSIAGESTVRPCEGCLAESYLLEYLLRYVRGLNSQIGSLEEYKADRPRRSEL